jgi:regulator of protease activity HflC (stomatin/prohibitin superfamily)
MFGDVMYGGHIADEIETELQHIASEWGIKLTRVEVTEVEVEARDSTFLRRGSCVFCCSRWR